MKKEKDKELCSVVTIEGQHMIKMPNGEMVPGVYSTKVTDTTLLVPYCVVTMKVKMKVNLE